MRPTMRRTLCLLGIGLLLSLAMIASAWAAGYYVGPNGSDDAGDGSQQHPWATLSKACSKATQAGDVIFVAAGSYTDHGVCYLVPGVSIRGAGKDVVKITTPEIKDEQATYIDGNSWWPLVTGNNEISGVGLYGVGDGKGIYLGGRNNVKIHDCYFENYDLALSVAGKVPAYRGYCDSRPSETAIYCDNDIRLSTEPGTSDWAQGVEIYNNQVKNARIQLHTIKGAKIHHNVIDNSTSFKSGFGFTAFWWNGVDFYENRISTKTNAKQTIALEVWMVENNTRFHNNWTNGWFSIIKNPNGPSEPYSWQIVDNTFESNAPVGVGSDENGCALETCYHVKNVLIEGNYFINTGSNNTYQRAIAIWGYGVNENFTIRRNVMVNMAYDAIVIQSDQTGFQKFDGDGFYIYNNIIDTAAQGKSEGVAIVDGVGDIDNVHIQNNIFMTVDHGVLVFPANHSVSGVEFTNNVVYNAKGFVVDMGQGAFSNVSDNYTFKPELNYAGVRPDPYYRPEGANANVVDKGAVVGAIAYQGAAPDIGAYELSDLSPPKSLRVIN